MQLHKLTFLMPQGLMIKLLQIGLFVELGLSWEC